MIDYIYTVKLTQPMVGEFVKDCCSFDGDVDVRSVDRSMMVDGKSILSVMSLNMNSPLVIQYHAKGADDYANFCKVMRKYAMA